MEPRKGIRIGSVLGAPILLMPSWFVVAIAITVIFAPNVSARAPGVGPAAYLIAFTFSALLLLSVFLHEVAHAVTARAVGVPPTHIVLDLWGGHTAFSDELPTPARNVIVAVSGPAMNGVIAVLVWWAGGFTSPDGVAGMLTLAVATSNGFVAVFNAIPGLPLDGGRVLEGVVWWIARDRSTGTLVAGWAGRTVAVLIIVCSVAWALLTEHLRNPLAAGSLIVVAVLLWRGAGQAVELARWRRKAPSVAVRSLLRRAVAIESGSTVSVAAEAAARAGVSNVVLLDIYGRPAALLDDAESASVSAEHANTVPVSVVARTLETDAIIDVELSGERFITTLQAAPHAEYAVIDSAGQVVGVLAWSDVADAVRSR